MKLKFIVLEAPPRLELGVKVLQTGHLTTANP